MLKREDSIRNIGEIIIDTLRLDFLGRAFREVGMHEKLLDVGCGVKPFKFIYEQYTKTSVGIDVNTSPHSQHVVDKIYDGRNIPFNDEDFDIVLSTEVMEHVMDPDLFLREINRVLKKNGVLILTVPFFVSLHEEPHDYYRYTIHGLKYLLHKSGFEVLRVESLGGSVCVFISMMTSVQLKVWHKLSQLTRFKPIFTVFNPFIFIFVYLPQKIYLVLYRLKKTHNVQKMPKGYGVIALKR